MSENRNTATQQVGVGELAEAALRSEVTPEQSRVFSRQKQRFEEAKRHAQSPTRIPTR